MNQTRTNLKTKSATLKLTEPTSQVWQVMDLARTLAKRIGNQVSTNESDELEWSITINATAREHGADETDEPNEQAINTVPNPVPPTKTNEHQTVGTRPQKKPRTIIRKPKSECIRPNIQTNIGIICSTGLSGEASITTVAKQLACTESTVRRLINKLHSNNGWGIRIQGDIFSIFGPEVPDTDTDTDANAAPDTPTAPQKTNENTVMEDVSTDQIQLDAAVTEDAQLDEDAVPDFLRMLEDEDGSA